MSVSIGMVCHFWEEANALPGLIETAGQFFDELLFVSTPPKGAPPDDESVAIIQKHGCRLLFDTIDDGFGAVRTRALHSLTTEWGMIMDADERFYPTHRVLHCHGTDKYPETKTPNLTIEIHDPLYNHGKALRDMISISNYDCIRASRRHWFDFSWKKPCQNWHQIPDWQARILRNKPNIGFQSDVKMHEKVRDFNTGGEPAMWRGDSTSRGIFFDHFHCYFKPMEPENNKSDMAIYQALDMNSTTDMWLNGAKGVSP